MPYLWQFLHAEIGDCCSMQHSFSVCSVCETERESFMLESIWQNFKVVSLFNQFWKWLQCILGILRIFRYTFLFTVSELFLFFFFFTVGLPIVHILYNILKRTAAFFFWSIYTVKEVFCDIQPTKNHTIQKNRSNLPPDRPDMTDKVRSGTVVSNIVQNLFAFDTYMRV